MVKMGLKHKRGNLKSDSVPTIQPQRPEALSEARKLADYGERRKRNTGDSESDSWQNAKGHEQVVSKFSVSRVSKAM